MKSRLRVPSAQVLAAQLLAVFAASALYNAGRAAGIRQTVQVIEAACRGANVAHGRA